MTSRSRLRRRRQARAPHGFSHLLRTLALAVPDLPAARSILAA